MDCEVQPASQPQNSRSPDAGAACRSPRATASLCTSHRLEARLAARSAAALLAGLLVIRHALDVFGQAFLLAQLLKPPDHLFGGLVAARFHPDHSNGPFEFPIRVATTAARANDSGEHEVRPDKVMRAA